MRRAASYPGGLGPEPAVRAAGAWPRIIRTFPETPAPTHRPPRTALRRPFQAADPPRAEHLERLLGALRPARGAVYGLPPVLRDVWWCVRFLERQVEARERALPTWPWARAVEGAARPLVRHLERLGARAWRREPALAPLRRSATAWLDGDGVAEVEHLVVGWPAVSSPAAVASACAVELRELAPTVDVQRSALRSLAQQVAGELLALAEESHGPED